MVDNSLGESTDPLRLNSLTSIAQSLIQHLQTDNFYPKLIEAINQLAPIDSVVVLALTSGAKPTLIYESLHPKEVESFHKIYMSGAYLLSPLYQNWAELRSGFYRISDLGEDFNISEFSKMYFQNSGLCDEANFVVKTAEKEGIAVCFGRQQITTPFSPAELYYLHLTAPMFQAAVKRQYESAAWAENSIAENNIAPNSARHTALTACLNNYAQALLTEREREVLAQMLKGKSSKMSAHTLNISHETERGHRKRIYAKLGVASQSELFAQVLDELTKTKY